MRARFLFVVCGLLAGEAGAQSWQPREQQAAPNTGTTNANGTGASAQQNGRGANDATTARNEVESRGGADRASEKSDSSDGQRSWLERILNEPLGPLNLLMVALSTVIAGGGLYLAWSARDNSHRQLRAYISVKDAKADRNGLQLSASVMLANVGQTPARNVRMAAELLLVDPKLMDVLTTYEFRDVTVKGVVWGPGLDLPPLKADRVLNNDEAKIVVHDRSALVVLRGRVEYHDIFDNLQHTDFRYVLEIPGNHLVPHNSGGNDAT